MALRKHTFCKEVVPDLGGIFWSKLCTTPFLPYWYISKEKTNHLLTIPGLPILSLHLLSQIFLVLHPPGGDRLIYASNEAICQKKQNIFKWRLSPVLEPSLDLSLAQSQGSGKLDPLWSGKITLGRKPVKWIPHQSGFSLLVILQFGLELVVWLWSHLLSSPASWPSLKTVRACWGHFNFLRQKYDNKVLP